MRSETPMNELIEEMARKFAARDAALHLEEFGEPISSATLDDLIKTYLFKGWVEVCKERDVNIREAGDFGTIYYPIFSTAYLKAVYGDEKNIRVTGLDMSENVNN
jgi:hypothetical protein